MGSEEPCIHCAKGIEAMTPDEARKWIQVRDLLIHLTGPEAAYHEVYKVAVGDNFGERHPWDVLEKLAADSIIGKSNVGLDTL